WLRMQWQTSLKRESKLPNNVSLVLTSVEIDRLNYTLVHACSSGQEARPPARALLALCPSVRGTMSTIHGINRLSIDNRYGNLRLPPSWGGTGRAKLAQGVEPPANSFIWHLFRSKPPARSLTKFLNPTSKTSCQCR